MILPILIFVIVLIVIHKYVFRDIDESEKNFQKIPGPKGLPFLGNIQDLFCNGEDRWKRLRARALEYYPIYKMEVLNMKMVHLLDPSDVEVILGDPKFTSKGRLYEPSKFWLGEGLLVSAGEKWRKGRKLLTKTFHFGVLKNYMHIFNEQLEILNKSFESKHGEPAQLTSLLQFHSLRIICSTTVGGQVEISKKSGESLLNSLETLTKIVGIKMTIPLMNFLYKFTYLLREEREALQDYNDFAYRLIEKNDDCKDMDEDTDHPRLLKVLLQNCDSEDVKDHMKNFLFAGQDTMTTTLTFYLYVLANKPEIQDEILNEILAISVNENPTYGEITQMGLLDRFIKECLRLYSPAPFIGRTVEEDVSLPSGYTIPAGTSVFIDIFDIHRHPKLYPNPEYFDPSRFLPENCGKRHPYSFIPFSAGPRNCIAQKVAMLGIKTTICGILKKFRIEPIGSLEDIIFVPHLLLKSKHPLEVKFIPRVSL
ncbi:cytochrome P450 4C1-like [Harmonia axyridis]|uniref:cytochrome P450 4C1-like n=1 Tax=Harmonia axyridis TaxID=115357 RepID=UPI001E275536|nr:cytochrome P450 4C1-like [Harmonia axyridis]